MIYYYLPEYPTIICISVVHWSFLYSTVRLFPRSLSDFDILYEFHFTTEFFFHSILLPFRLYWLYECYHYLIRDVISLSSLPFFEYDKPILNSLNFCIMSILKHGVGVRLKCDTLFVLRSTDNFPPTTITLVFSFHIL